MKKELFNLKNLIEVRRWFHKHAELSLKEFNTCQKLQEELKKIGVLSSEITIKVKTGLQVDLKGIGDPVKNPKIIALRADCDALPIKENNKEIGKY